MQDRLKRDFVLSMLFFGVAAILVGCGSIGAPMQHPNGLTCQAYTSSLNQGLTTTKGTDCRFKCPDGRLLSLPEAVVSQSKDELNFLFCGVPLPENAPAPGENAVSASTAAPLGTPVPLLTSLVDSCDLTRGTIGFAFAQPAQSLIGKPLQVDIQGQPSQCGVDPINSGSLLCKLPPHTSFPAGIVVRFNGQIVNFFAYAGGGCKQEQAALPKQTRAVDTIAATTLPGQHPSPQPTSVPPTQVPPTPVPPTLVPPTLIPPTPVPPTPQPPTQEPPTSQPPTQEPPTAQPPTPAPPPTQEATQPNPFPFPWPLPTKHPHHHPTPTP